MERKRYIPVWRQSVVLHWFITYVSILIVPVILSGLVYVRTHRVIQQEILRANSALLQQIQSDMDNKLSDMQRLSIQIGLNPRLRALWRDGSALSSQDYNEMMADFRVYRLSNSAVDSFYVFLHGQNTLLTPDTMMSGPVYEEVLRRRFRTLSGAPLDNILRQRSAQGFRPLIKHTAGTDSTVIAFLQPLPVDRTDEPQATLLILLDKNQLVKTLRNIDWIDSGVVFVMDEQNNLLACSRDDISLPDALRYSNLTDEDALYIYEAEGEKYTAAHQKSAVTGLKYVSVLPSATLWKKANDVRGYTFVAVLCSLALGGALAWLFTRQNYIPVKRLASQIAREAGTDLMPGQSEFHFMQEAVDTAFGTLHAVDQVKDRHLIHLRRSFIARLLKNNLEGVISPQEALKLYDIHFATDRFCVLLFFIREIQGDILKNASQDEEVLARYVVRNVCEELFNRNHFALMTTADDLQALLVNIHPCDDFMEECRAHIHMAEQFLQHHFGIVLSVAASEVQEGLDHIPKAYTEAYTTMEYSVLMGNNGLVESHHVAYGFGGSNDSYYYYYPLKVEVQLTNFIKSGAYSDAKEIVTMLLDRNFRQYNPPQQIAKCFMYNLTSTMLKTTHEISSICDGEPPDVSASIERLLICSSYTELDMELDKLLIMLCSYTLNKTKGRDFVQLAQSYIDENYSDPGLGVAQIAEHLLLTPSYLSKWFRQCCGITLPDAICHARLEMAKQMLAQTSAPLQEIAVKCGFINSNTLIRTFKRYEGITPGRYRDINSATAKKEDGAPPQEEPDDTSGI